MVFRAKHFQIKSESVVENTRMKELYETLKTHDQNFTNTGKRMSKMEEELNKLHQTMASIKQNMEYLLKKSNETMSGSEGRNVNMTEGSENGKARQEDYNPSHVRNTGHHLNYNPTAYKVNFPDFNGENPQGWIREANRFFQLKPNENTKKVLHAGYYMVGVADTWYTEYIEGKGRLDIDWETFCEMMLQRFLAPGGEDIVIEIERNIRVCCKGKPGKQDEVTNGSTSVAEFDSSSDDDHVLVICGLARCNKRNTDRTWEEANGAMGATKLLRPFSEIADSLELKERFNPGCCLEYLLHGNGAVVEALVQGLMKFHGRLSLKSHVDSIIVEDGRAIGVKLRGGQIVRAKMGVIRNASIWDTLSMLPKKVVPKDYQRFEKTHLRVLVNEKERCEAMRVEFDGNYFIWDGKVQVCGLYYADKEERPEFQLKQYDYFGHGLESSNHADVIAWSKNEHKYLLNTKLIWCADRSEEECSRMEQILHSDSVEATIFQGITLPDALKFGKVIGGQFVGQALAVASKTVDCLKLVHSLHCYFLLVGEYVTPIIYQVHRVREGKNFAARRMEAIQKGNVVFTIFASFQKEEDNLLLTTYGKLQPLFGTHRLMVVEFIAVLVVASNGIVERASFGSNSPAIRPLIPPGFRNNVLDKTSDLTSLIPPHLSEVEKLETGKTSLCKALVQKLSICFNLSYSQSQLIEVNAHSLFSKWFSESGKLVAKLFSKIQEMVEEEINLVFVLIDEVEGLAAARKATLSGSEISDSKRVVNALLTQMDKLKSSPNVIILTTSITTAAIDIAFVDRACIKAYVGPPILQAQYEILRSCLSELWRTGILSNSQEGNGVLTALNLVIDKGLVDPSQVAVLGEFLTTHLISQAPDKYVAAAAKNPGCNLAFIWDPGGEILVQGSVEAQIVLADDNLEDKVVFRGRHCHVFYINVPELIAIFQSGAHSRKAVCVLAQSSPSLSIHQSNGQHWETGFNKLVAKEYFYDVSCQLRGTIRL